jgi:SHS2 domain-containing protein
MQKNNKIYEQIDHTADMYIRVRGTALHNLFEKAAFALFDIMVELDNVKEEASERIQLEGNPFQEVSGEDTRPCPFGSRGMGGTFRSGTA